MSDIQEEIKEILDNFEKYEARYRLHDETQFIITHREIQILLDCITNLQEENERLNNIIKETIEYIKEYGDTENIFIPTNISHKTSIELLEILDKENK